MTKTSKPDWRSLPRKPADQVLSRELRIRISAGELDTLRRRASDEKTTVSEYVRSRLGLKP